MPFDRYGNMWHLLQLGILQSSDIDGENRVRIRPLAEAEAGVEVGVDAHAPIRCASPELPELPVLPTPSALPPVQRRRAPQRVARPTRFHAVDAENADPNVRTLQREIQRLEAEACVLRRQARRADLLEHLVDGFCKLKSEEARSFES